MSGWCQVKIAHLLPANHELVDIIVDEKLFQYNWNEALPEGWDLVGSDISGAAGFVILFEIDHLPTEPELLLVKHALNLI